MVAELCDDRVVAEGLPVVPGEGLVTDTWREWEVELVDGDPEACSRSSILPCAHAGASPATRASKVQRILADRLRTDGWRRHATTRVVRPLGEVFLAYLTAELDRLLVQDRAFRAGAVDEPVHQMRVAARRLRAPSRPSARWWQPRGAHGRGPARGAALARLLVGRGPRHQVLRGRLDTLLEGERIPRPRPLAGMSTGARRPATGSGLTDAEVLAGLDDERHQRLARGPAADARRAGAAGSRGARLEPRCCNEGPAR